MQTQTHVLVAALFLTRPAARRENTAVFCGALAPDASIFILFAWARGIAGIPEHTLWGETYWSEPWQTLSALSNSVPLYALLLVLGLLSGRRMLLLFGTAALIHLALDLPLHALDAHRHFWPLSDWRFISPVSYWDPAYHGRWMMLGEAMLGITASILLWRRFNTRVPRTVLALLATAYLGVPLYFAVALASG